MARSASQQRQANGQKAAIYARVSDKSQDTEDKTSISEQISDMEAHCQRRGLTITASQRLPSLARKHCQTPLPEKPRKLHRGK